MFPDILSSSYTLTTASFVSLFCNMFIVIMNTASFKDVEEVTVKSLLLVETVVISEVNLTSIFKMIVNSEFIVIIPF